MIPFRISSLAGDLFLLFCNFLCKMVASSVLEVFRFSCFTLASCFRRAVLAHLAHLSVQRHDMFLGVFFFRSARVEDHLSMWAAFSRKASPIGTSPLVG